MVNSSVTKRCVHLIQAAAYVCYEGKSWKQRLTCCCSAPHTHNSSNEINVQLIESHEAIKNHFIRWATNFGIWNMKRGNTKKLFGSLKTNKINYLRFFKWNIHAKAIQNWICFYVNVSSALNFAWRKKKKHHTTTLFRHVM